MYLQKRRMEAITMVKRVVQAKGRKGEREKGRKGEREKEEHGRSVKDRR
jgi:hypothetical protein